MKIRKQYIPPVPPSEDSEEVQYAKAVAAAINQGMPGQIGARLINVVNPKQVQHAATLSVHELVDWFKKDQAAREIFDRVPSFAQFVADFHAAAREMYPPSSPFFNTEKP